MISSAAAICAVLVTTAQTAPGTQGQWQTLSSLLPSNVNPIHVALMNNGMVLLVSGSGNDPASQDLEAAVWDPQTGNLVTQPVAWDLFCNGMSVLPDGRVLITGGTLSYDPFRGALRSALFDPATRVFSDVANMAHGRWYPTLTTLGDGRVMTFSGLTETSATNMAVEIFTPGVGWSPEYVAEWTPPLYPRQHLLPNGTVVYTGSGTGTRTFDPSTHIWSDVIANTIYSGMRTYGSSVLLPLSPTDGYKPLVMIFGGGNPATATTEVIDLSVASPQWQAGPSMSQPRIEGNATLLPNRKVLVVGGSANDEDATTASLNADLFDPTVSPITVTSAGANAYPRLYHSNALLLPDARVLLVGSNPVRGSFEQHMEIYSPSYLFNADGSAATRPTTGTVTPRRIPAAGTFQVQTPNAAAIRSVVAVRPGTPTHSFDNEQRLISLSYTAASGVLNVTAPPNGNIAPPGYYLLFLVNSAGVPSVGTFVQLGADMTAPTVTATSPTAGATAVVVGTPVTGTFSEAMAAGTLTAATVTLVPQGSTTPVTATVTYDAPSRTVTLQPVATLATSTRYTATIKGGVAGVTDLAGNPLAANASWTFTTGATAAKNAYLSDLSWTSMINGWGPIEKDRSNGESAAGDGRVLTVNGVTYAKGLGAHASSDVRYALNGVCSVFSAVVGVDDEVGIAGSIVFQVWTDGVKRYDSGLMFGTTGTAPINVDVTGATELALIITDGGDGNSYDHGDWANAQLTCAADTTAPTVTATSPTAGATGVVVTTPVTGTFSEAMAPGTLTAATVTLVPQGSTTPVTATVTYDAPSKTVTLQPAATLATSTRYTATIKGGAGGVTDLAGNPLAANASWTFTTAATTATSIYVSDLTWTSMTNGWGPVEKDRSNAEAAAGDGRVLTLNGVTYAKGLGAHAPSDVRYALNGACSVFTVAVGVDDEVGAAGSIVFQVWTDGVKRYDSGLMTGATATAAANVSVTGATELALIITDGGDGNSFDHGDWANAQLACAADTTPPTVTATSPAAGATGVVVTSPVTGAFSEAMAPGTVTAATVTLVPQGSTTPVTATVTYDAPSKTVILQPAATLATSTRYTATIKGGAAGVTDLAGNPLAASVTWTFTTAATTATNIYLSDLTWTSMTNGWGPVENDRSNGEAAAGDGRVLTLNGVTYAKGLGAHAASDVRYALKGVCSVFTSVVGLDDEVGAAGSIVFQVWTDGVKRYDSGLMTGATATAAVNVNVTGATELALIITDGGDDNAFDHGDWANAQVGCTTSPAVVAMSPAAPAAVVSVAANPSGTVLGGDIGGGAVYRLRPSDAAVEH